ncbi:hypothetical protein, partial [Lactobacillus acetotolerans]|uniref:hypothetical protein n=1 Tax=Lactobacillus acetotolerans TaxID=1600 RepID=UPI0019CFB1B2
NTKNNILFHHNLQVKINSFIKPFNSNFLNSASGAHRLRRDFRMAGKAARFVYYIKCPKDVWLFALSSLFILSKIKSAGS